MERSESLSMKGRRNTTTHLLPVVNLELEAIAERTDQTSA